MRLLFCSKKRGMLKNLDVSHHRFFNIPILILYVHACGMHYTHDRAKMMRRLYVLGAMMRLLNDFLGNSLG